MTDPSARTFSGDFRRFFLRGLVVLLPSVLTLWLVVKAYQFVDNTIAEPINRGVRVAMINSARVWSPLQDVFDPTTEQMDLARQAAIDANADVLADEALLSVLRAENINVWWSAHWYMDVIGLVVAIVAVYIAGRLLGGFVGRRIYRKIEGVITTLPVFKQVYPYVKQVVDFLFSDDQPIKFNRVVAIEYPRKGIWSVGFMTGDAMRSVAEEAGDSVTVFIPSSPTPFTGYTLTIPRDEIVKLPISVEEAIRFAVSGGVLVPPHQTMSQAEPLPQLGGKPLPSGLIPIAAGEGVDEAAGPEAGRQAKDHADGESEAKTATEDRPSSRAG